MPSTLTLTYYAERYRHIPTGREGMTPWNTREAAEMNGIRDSNMTFERLGVDEVTITYSLGQRVQVHSFGAWRDGTVTRLGRTKVTVKHWRNRAHTVQSERPFGASSIRPWQPS